MNRRTALALAILAGSSSALAAPRDTFTGTDIPSVDNVGSADNARHTLVVTEAYTVSHLTFTGALGNVRSPSWTQEASVLVTPPSGAANAFVIQASSQNTGTAGTFTTFTLPVQPESSVGTWNFEFFDNFDDLTTPSGTFTVAFDAVWSTVSIALNDGAAPLPPSVGTGPSVTFTNVQSDGLFLSPAQTRTWNNTTPFTGTSMVFRTRGIITSLTGQDGTAQLTSTNVSEAGIRVTPPVGNVFFVQVPERATSSMSVNIATTAITGFSGDGTGTWTFEFAESSTRSSTGTDGDYAGVDNLWNSVSFELVDITPVATTISTPGDGQWHTASRAIAGAGDIAWFTFTTPADLDSTGAVDIDTIGSSLSPANDTDIGLYTAAGVFMDSDEDDSTDQLSQLSYGQTTSRRNATGNGLRFAAQDGTTAGGTGNIAASTQYFLAVAGGNTATHASTFNTVGGINTGSATARVRVFATNAPNEPLAPPAGAEALGTLTHAVPVTDTETIPNGGLKWYSLNVPAISPAFNSALEIDTSGTTSPTANDTGIALYRADGSLVTSDTADGIDSFGALSYGADNRPSPGNGVAFNGRDGNLQPGTYYLAVTVGGAPTFSADFGVTGVSATQSGSITTSVTYFNPSLSATATPPAVESDLGVIGSSTRGEEVETVTQTAVAGNDLDWYKFEIVAEASNATDYYLDIDTEGTDPSSASGLTAGAVHDSELGVYSSLGLMVANDDDEGSGFRSALSFGDTTPNRPAINTTTSTGAIARNGRDGPLAAAVYYLAVSTNSTTHNATDFNVVPPTNRTSTGDRLINFRTNLPADTGCGLADVAGGGQTPGADGDLTADDIVVFIGWFFGSDTRADIASGGQVPGSDGDFTADDIIVFINAFFAGC